MTSETIIKQHSEALVAMTVVKVSFQDNLKASQGRHCEVGGTEEKKVGAVRHKENKTRGEVTVLLLRMHNIS